MASVRLEGVSKVYANGTRAVSDLSLAVDDGELLVLIGPSGCGKTTALRMVAGFEAITSGFVRIGNRVVNHLTPRDRDTAMIFQNYALYPHLTVADNIALGLKLRGVRKPERARRAREAAELLGLSEQLNRKPAQLSGGQRQRVAMGRVIVREPTAFLMDEPLSNLDAKLRVQMRTEILRIHRRLGVATLYVTHDQAEALTMGDRVAVMREGVLLQCDSPAALYRDPATMYVAAFIGSPPMNLYEADLRAGADGLMAVVGDQRLDVPAPSPALSRLGEARVVIGIRPEALSLPSPNTPPGATLSVSVEQVEALGSANLAHFSISAPRVLPRDAGPAARLPGGVQEELEPVTAAAAHGVARLGARTPVTAGLDVTLAVDTAGVRFFDPETGAAIR